MTISYTGGLSKRMKKVMKSYGIVTLFKPHNLLCHCPVHDKDKTPKEKTNVYLINPPPRTVVFGRNYCPNKVRILKNPNILNTSEEDIRNARNGKNPSVNTKSSARINFKIGDLNDKSVLMEANCTR